MPVIFPQTSLLRKLYQYTIIGMVSTETDKGVVMRMFSYGSVLSYCSPKTAWTDGTIIVRERHSAPGYERLYIQEWAGALASSRESTPPRVVHPENRWAPNCQSCYSIPVQEQIFQSFFPSSSLKNRKTLSFLAQLYTTAKGWDHQRNCTGGAPPRPVQAHFY